MAHIHQTTFVNTISKHLSNKYDNSKILEVGSYDVNGTIRKFFKNSDYTGVDLTEGPGVDIVIEGNLIDLKSESFDITISCECFEHNPYWKETLLNMIRMTKKGGFVIFTCATSGRIEHGTKRTNPKESPGTSSIGWDYYKNLTIKDFKKDINLDIFSNYLFIKNKIFSDLYFVGQKKGKSKKFKFNESSFLENYKIDQKNIFKKLSYREKFYCFNKILIFYPLHLFTFLPDRLFQNIAVNYKKTIQRFYRLVEK